MSFLPNALTILRIVLVPVFVVAFFCPAPWGPWVVFVLFCLAGISDASTVWSRASSAPGRPSAACSTPSPTS